VKNLEQPLGGEEGPTIPPSKTFRGEEEVVGKSGRGLRIPFLRKSFTGGSTTFFARGSATEAFLIAKSADVVFSYFNNNTTRNKTNRCRIMSILRVSIHRECIGCMHQVLIKLVIIYPLESMLFFL